MVLQRTDSSCSVSMTKSDFMEKVTFGLELTGKIERKFQKDMSKLDNRGPRILNK